MLCKSSSVRNKLFGVDYFEILEALIHETNPNIVMTSKTISAATILW